MKIDDSTYSLVEEFANTIDTSFYGSRNQNDNEKRRKDQVCGKLGEYCVYYYLKPYFPDITEPDLKIYQVSEKSWDYDLKAKNINIHVKAQDIEIAKRFGTSWIFQYGDRGVFDEDTTNQYVAFVTVDLENREADIKAFVKVKYLHDQKLFRLPRKESLKILNKKAVYLNDLNFEGDENLFQLDLVKK